MMGKFNCSCGEVLSTVGCPNPYEGYLLSDYNLDDDIIDDVSSIKIMDIARDVRECDKCGRVWFEEPRGSNKWVSYIPENGKYNGLLKGKE
ncbi:MAG: hypothetical protein JXA96_17300 [Sedimentisphaerales bacterium]|nr:hypothetical protein [Sedimentisphaerales bacterium]